MSTKASNHLKPYRLLLESLVQVKITCPDFFIKYFISKFKLDFLEIPRKSPGKIILSGLFYIRR